MDSLLLDVSPAEFIDRYIILTLKRDRFDGPKRDRALDELCKMDQRYPDFVAKLPTDAINGMAALTRINSDLWDVENAIRELDPKVFMAGEKAQDDDLTRYAALARKVYVMNDLRSEVKRTLNEVLDASALNEPKQYPKYRV